MPMERLAHFISSRRIVPDNCPLHDATAAWPKFDEGAREQECGYRRRGAPAPQPASARKFSDPSGASSACLRCGGGSIGSSHPRRPYPWWTAYVKRAMWVRAGAVSLLVRPLYQGSEQVDRLKWSRQLVSLASTRARGTSASHASARLILSL